MPQEEYSTILSCSPIRNRIKVQGNVQGVGFRPFVWKRATSIDLTGWVLNNSSGVTIEIQGSRHRIQNFLEGFSQAAPPLARIDTIVVEEIAVSKEQSFTIRQSKRIANESTPIASDISICDDCLRELRDTNDRRYLYPFINCTNCGPRFTIIEDIPYDRPLTTMKAFAMCSQCQQEYDNPADRRFHAQPNACPDCGPRIWFVADKENATNFSTPGNDGIVGLCAIDCFKAAIKDDKIVAVKGIGGFHLACHAGSNVAINNLRERKGRIEKPFGLMVANVNLVESFAIVGENERRLLESAERPIVLLKKRSDSSQRRMLDDVAPGNDFVGVMLPYSPLHHLLLDDLPLVMTSGNLVDEPIVRTNADAQERLASLADSFLLHDRGIHSVCDDSVVRCVGKTILPIRRSRGYAPLPIKLGEPGPCVLAIGGEIKSTFCITKKDYAYVSQHIGDMGNVETIVALRQSIEHFIKLFRAKIEAVVADLHPGYLSSQCARKMAQTLKIPFVQVQHHYAHTASLISESCWPEDQAIIACCFDGTGYGTDGAIWGGEFLIADGQDYQRYAHLKYFPMPGGDASIKKPSRVAMAQLWVSTIPWDQRLPCVASFSASEQALLNQQLEKEINCVASSSMGRLFDSVSSLIGIRHEVSYEAQAAMEMEALATEVIEDVDPSAYAFDILKNRDGEIGYSALLQSICNDVVSGVERRVMAAQFHHATASMVAKVCEDARKKTGIQCVGLTGGVFQNVLLLQLVRDLLVQSGFKVLTHSIVPPNDGGLSLGQAFVARNRIAEGKHSTR